MEDVKTKYDGMILEINIWNTNAHPSGVDYYAPLTLHSILDFLQSDPEIRHPTPDNHHF